MQRWTQVYIGIDIGNIGSATGQSWIREAKTINAMLGDFIKHYCNR